MRIYDVSLITPGQVGGELYARLSVERDGRKIWENACGGAQVFCDDAQKRLIEEAVERYPRQQRLSVGHCLVQRRTDQEEPLSHKPRGPGGLSEPLQPRQ